MGNSVHIEITDNSGLVKEAFEAAVLRALEKCGLTAEAYAKMLAPSPGKTGTGALRNSITHLVAENKNTVYVGVPQGPTSYGIYLELGTGKYYPGGRPTPWTYQDIHGNWHLTHGQRAQPYIKPAVADHVSTYRQIVENELKG